MPHLTLALSAGGPLVDVSVGVSAPRALVLAAMGQSVPTPVPARALVDTGASCTCIDAVVLAQLSLRPTGLASMITATTGAVAQTVPQYDVSLTLTHPQRNVTMDAIPVVQAALAHQGIHLLLGRDVLSQCLFVYDGQAGTFALSF